MNKTYTASICTLGCRVNQYESDAIAETLESSGFVIVPFGDTCDAAIINTCAVTAESVRKSRQHIRRAASCAGAVIVTGCASELSPDEIFGLDGVTVVTGNTDKDKIPAIVLDIIGGKREHKLLSAPIDSAPYDGFTVTKPRRSRAYVKIEDGCDNRCAYCIIPSLRGKVRSKPHDDIINEVSTLTSGGMSEIILTGIETASYGRDTGSCTLAGLISDVAKIDGVKRLTLGSLEPTILTDAFLDEVTAIPALLPHFHISVQSGSTGVLRRMRRRYNSDMLLSHINKAKSAMPQLMLSADVIVGFPGETDAEFRETLEFCRGVRFLHLHIFPYSIRKGTEAAAMKDQVPYEVKRERVKELEAMQAEIKSSLLDEYCQEHDASNPAHVLIEEGGDGFILGHSEHYVEFRIPSDECPVGRTMDIRAVSHDGVVCTGEII